MGRVTKRAPDRGRDDRGNVAALEAVFIGMLLMSSVAILSSLAPDKPTIPSASQAPLRNLAEDALAGLQSIPTNDRYQNELNKIIAKAYVGNTSSLDSYMSRSLPPGAGYRLWLDNGHARTLLVGKADASPPRQSVSATRLWHPDWDYAVLLPSFDIVPSTMSMPLAGYAVAQGALVKEGGIPITIDVNTTQANYTASYITSIGTGPSAHLRLYNETNVLMYNYTDPVPLPTLTTTLYSATRSGLPATATFTVTAGTTVLSTTTTTAFTGCLALCQYTLTLTAPAGAVPGSYTCVVTAAGGAVGTCSSITSPPVGQWTVSASATGGTTPTSSTVTVKATGPIYNADWTFVVQETGGKVLPAGTNVTFYFPTAFSGVELTNTTQAGWTNIVQGTWSGGQKLSAELATNIAAGGARNLTVHASRGTATPDAMYIIRAEMGNGASGSGTFAIGGIGSVSTGDANPVQHKLYLETSKPATAGGAMNLGVLLAYPTVANNPLATEDIQSATITAPAGTFAGVTLSSGFNGWTFQDSSTLVWQGSTPVRVGTNKVGILNVTALIASNTTSSEAAIRMPIQFPNGYADKMFDASQPYLSVGAFPPSSGAATTDGFPRSWLGTPINMTSQFYTRGAYVDGTGTYNVTAAGTLATLAENMRVGLAQSTLSITKREMRVGETVNITANFTPLVNKLSTSISSWQMELNIYDPAQPFEPFASWTPKFQAVRTTGTMPPSFSNTFVQANFTAGDDAFYGPHLVLAQAKYLVLGTNIIETARIPLLLNVTPDGGQAETSLYWVLLEAWMPDWS